MTATPARPGHLGSPLIPSLSVRPNVSAHLPFDVARRTSSPRRLALAVAALVALTSVFAYASPSRTFGWDNESFSASSEADLVALTNRSRANAGLRALRVDSALRSVARWRSKDMIERDYFSHTIPGYGKVWDKLQSVGYCYKLAGENIGWNNYPDDTATTSIHDQFMNSSGHRANIVGDWDNIGVGAYKGPTGKKMWTVLFADKCGTTSTAPKATAKPAPRATRKAATPEPTPAIVEAPLATPRLDDGDLIPAADESDAGATGDGSNDPDASPDRTVLRRLTPAGHRTARTPSRSGRSRPSARGRPL